ncbi:parallel beta-helix domain-containing protein [uncultured Abyssibacter sp.]|uniref:parallel beta-helix domain-containing protein n=1 Tax=uncultured Abyssibacter sp. TaxID=2320202 RepID=UPI0032B1FEE3
MNQRMLATAGLLLAALMSGCGSSSQPGNAADGGSDTVGRTFIISPGPDATSDMVAAMVQARPKDEIRFDCGYFELETGFQLTNTEDVLVKGCGIDDTVLSFKNSQAQEGFLAINVRGLVVEDLTVLDSPGDAFKLKGVNHGTLTRVRAMWSSGRLTEDEDTITADNYADKLNVTCVNPQRSADGSQDIGAGEPGYRVSVASGRYGIYPVESENILVQHTESVGASDAGIYVGQTDNTIIRDSRAAYNVFGFEIENVRGGEYVNNLSECNTGGFLVYDLDGLTRYGKATRMYGNVAVNNNTYNFAEPGTLVSNVPRGVGMITLAYDKLDIFENEFRDNDTAGIVHTSYELFGPPGDRRLDMYGEGVRIYNNVFSNNGNNLPPPDVAAIIETGGEQVTSAFPTLVGLKNQAGGDQYRGGHILWDGYADVLDADCPYPTDNQGQPIPQDAEGRPIQGNQYPNPDCRYNAYKFDDEGTRIKPTWWFSCIDADNDFADDSLTFANFHGTEGLEAVFLAAGGDPSVLLDPAALQEIIAGVQDFPSSFDMADHDCPTAYGSNLPPLPPVVIPPFVPSGDVDPAPTAEEIALLCDADVPVGQINAAAFKVNCPTLDQYHLFSDPADPLSLPNGRGLPFTLNSKLFTDYSTKYRVAYLPDGMAAQYRDTDDGVNATILFPVGTIIAKTFAFADETAGTEIAAETRLLIKRQRDDGQVYWDGLEYIWTEVDGERVAELKLGGGSASVSWDYTDVDSGVRHTGSTANYLFPNANQCITCHGNNDVETGAAPIGPKPRNLNRAYRADSAMAAARPQHAVDGVNQIAFWCDNGFLTNCPTDLGVDPATQVASNVEHLPIFNVPGDAGFPAGSDEDIEARARAYIEINCAHCHNAQGQASNTGFYVDWARPVDGVYGICKGPTATGTEGRGGRSVDIHPGDAADSIVPYRIGPEADTIAARMPPIARSVVHDEAHALLVEWIDTVIDDSYANADACGGGGLFASR